MGERWVPKAGGVSCKSLLVWEVGRHLQHNQQSMGKKKLYHLSDTLHQAETSDMASGNDPR